MTGPASPSSTGPCWSHLKIRILGLVRHALSRNRCRAVYAPKAGNAARVGVVGEWHLDFAGR